MRKALHQHARAQPSLDEIAHQLRLVEVADDEVVSTRILLSLRSRSPRLFMVVLAVNEGGESVARVTLHALPDVEHRATRRIHHHATDAAQDLEVGDRDSERRQDHDVLWLHAAEINLPASHLSAFAARLSPTAYRCPRHQKR